MTNKEPSIKKNYFYNIMYQLIASLTPLLLTPYISRVLGPANLGINSYVTANITYFQLFAMLGISGHGQREIAIARDDQDKRSKIFWELQILHTVLAILMIILYFVFISFIFSSRVRIFYIVGTINLVASLLDISWFYQGIENFGNIAVKNIITRLFVIILSFLLVKDSNDLFLYILIQALGLFFSNLFLWTKINNYIEPLKVVKEIKPLRHLKSVIIFFIPTIAASVYSILDKSVINIVTHSDKENGYYEQAYNILNILNVIVANLSTVMAPRMSKLYGEGNLEEMKKYLNHSLVAMLFVSIPISFGMASVAKNFIPIFLGQGYTKVINLIYVFMPLVIVLGFSVYIDGMYLVPSGQRLQSAMAICAGAVFNFVFNFILVAYMKSFGAALATLLTELLVTGIMIYLARSVLDRKLIIHSAMKYLSFGLVIFLVSILIDHYISNILISLIIQIISGAIVYILLLVLFKDDIFFELLKKVKL